MFELPVFWHTLQFSYSGWIRQGDIVNVYRYDIASKVQYEGASKYVVQYWNCFNIQCSEACPYIFDSLVPKCYHGDFAYLQGAISSTTIPYMDIQLYTLWQICEKSVMFTEVQYFLKKEFNRQYNWKKNTCLFVSFCYFGMMTVTERS
jgi:hypothetical protein